MMTSRRFAVVAILALAFAACSSGGSGDDDVTVDAERPRDAVSEPSGTDDHMASDEDHMDDHMASDDGPADEVVAPDGAHTVEVEMTEFAFEPDAITVPAGEPIRFVFHNTGVIEHEAMVGDAHMQEEFEASHDHGGAGHHGEVHAATVAPGETGELTVTFDEPGETMLGCHLEGHWPAGMAATVTVTA